jgi:hypothetical protein
MTGEERNVLIQKLEALPGQVAAAIAGSTEQQLLRPYREGGWNSRQVVHHLADSHMNAYIRSRLILTEDHPPLKPYDQDAWAKLPDSSTGPLSHSLEILRGLHARWAAFFRSLPEPAWTRTGFHPEYGDVSLEEILLSYVRHGENHVEHIKAGIGR